MKPRDDAQGLDLKWEAFSSIEVPNDHWLVKGLLPSQGVGILAGPSGAGKSFIALDLAVGIARGEAILGRKSKAGGIAYIAAEGANGVKKRIVALREKVGQLSANFELSPVAPNLVNDDAAKDWLKSIKALSRKWEAEGCRLSVVIIDTFSASIPGADENSSKDMSTVLDRLQGLSSELDLLVLIVAHVGKDADRGVRGWSGLKANVDTCLLVQPPQGRDDVRVLKIDKNKDGELGREMPFALDVVQVGMDEDGDPITTCVVKWLDPSACPARTSKPRALPDAGAIVLRLLRRLEDDGHVEPITGPGIPPDAKGIRKKALQDALQKREDDSSPNGSPETELELRQRRGRERKRVDNGLNQLEQRYLIRRERDLIWIAKNSSTSVEMWSGIP